MKTIASMVAVAALFAFPALAQESLDEINAKLDELGGEKIELAGEIRDFRAKLRQSVNDPKIMNNAIIQKRKVLDDLIQKVAALNEEIALEIAKMPQFADGYVKMTNNVVRLEDIERQRKELLAKRAELEKK